MIRMIFARGIEILSYEEIQVWKRKTEDTDHVPRGCFAPLIIFTADLNHTERPRGSY